jgi:TnpA family transposase
MIVGGDSGAVRACPHGVGLVASTVGRQRGSTLYTSMADTHASFHQTQIPGTLYALDGLRANQTVVHPDTVSTDAAGASEIVRAPVWTLGYRYAPRLADVADHRLCRIDPAVNSAAVSVVRPRRPT